MRPCGGEAEAGPAGARMTLGPAVKLTNGVETEAFMGDDYIKLFSLLVKPRDEINRLGRAAAKTPTPKYIRLYKTKFI